VDAKAGRSGVDKKVINQILADHAYGWTTATDEYPSEPVGDALQVSQAMMAKYGKYFASCPAQ
jgi:hypothetical protein